MDFRYLSFLEDWVLFPNTNICILGHISVSGEILIFPISCRQQLCCGLHVQCWEGGFPWFPCWNPAGSFAHPLHCHGVTFAAGIAGLGQSDCDAQLLLLMWDFNSKSSQFTSWGLKKSENGDGVSNSHSLLLSLLEFFRSRGKVYLCDG